VQHGILNRELSVMFKDFDSLCNINSQLALLEEKQVIFEWF